MSSALMATLDSSHNEIPTVLRGAGVELNVDAHTVNVHGARVPVRPQEFRLLLLLMDNAGHVVTTDQLLDELWGENFAGDPSTLKVHVLRLRAKLGRSRHTGSPIRTVRGIGYIFDGPTGTHTTR